MTTLLMFFIGMLIAGAAVGVTYGGMRAIESAKRPKAIESRSHKYDYLEQAEDEDKDSTTSVTGVSSDHREQLNELMPYLSQDEVTAFYADENPLVRERYLLSWKMDRMARERSAFLSLKDAPPVIQEESIKKMNELILSEHDIHKLRGEYRRLADMIPQLTQETAEEFTVLLDKFVEDRSEVLNVRLAMEMAHQTTLLDLKGKFFAYLERYPHQTARWDRALTYLAKFENGSTFTPNDINNLRTLAEHTEHHCFLINRRSEKVVRIKVDPDAKMLFRVDGGFSHNLHPKSDDSDYRFYYDDGTMGRNITLGGEEYRIISQNYAGVGIRKVPSQGQLRKLAEKAQSPQGQKRAIDVSKVPDLPARNVTAHKIRSVAAKKPRL